MSRDVIDVDQDTCISSGNCTAIAGDWFAFDDDDRVIARQPRVDEDVPPVVHSAAVQCPVSAIRIDATGDVR